jgi:hypothetical protein
VSGFYVGVALLLLVAAVIIGAVIWSIDPLLAVSAIGGSLVLTGAIYLGLNLIHGGF